MTYRHPVAGFVMEQVIHPVIAAWQRLEHLLQLGPVRWAALATGTAAIFHVATYFALSRALGANLRASPIQLSEAIASHSQEFAFIGIVGFATYALTLFVIGGILLTHRGSMRPAVWVFTVLMGAGALLWMSFAALSVPLGTSLGPAYADAMDHSGLTPAERASLWTTRAEGTDSPPLIVNGQLQTYSPSAQAFLLQAWSDSQDIWLARKASDALYFCGNGLFVVAMLFFARSVLSSKVFPAYTATCAIAIALAYGLGFLAFVSGIWDDAVKAAVVLHGGWLVLLAWALWNAPDPVRPRKAATDATVAFVQPAPGLRATVSEALAISDPSLRNFRITLAYAELAAELGSILEGGDPVNGNWCHFAVWASRSVGRDIRSRSLGWPFSQSGGATDGPGRFQPVPAWIAPRTGFDPTTDEVHLRVGGMLARGNVLVFADVGPALASTIEWLRANPTRDDRGFEAHLRRLDVARPRHGWTQGLIRSWRRVRRHRRKVGVRTGLPSSDGDLPTALRHYYQARHSPAERSQLILLANLQMLLWEQKRLQPLIEDAARTPAARILLAFFYPEFLVELLIGWLRWRGWGPRATQAINRRALGLVRVLCTPVQEVVTAQNIELAIGLKPAEDTTFCAARDVFDPENGPPPYPDELARPTLPGLVAFLEDWDRSAAIGGHTAVGDYASLADRINFIQAIFRMWQQSPVLRESPFAPSEVATIHEECRAILSPAERPRKSQGDALRPVAAAVGEGAGP